MERDEGSVAKSEGVCSSFNVLAKEGEAVARWWNGAEDGGRGKREGGKGEGERSSYHPREFLRGDAAERLRSIEFEVLLGKSATEAPDGFNSQAAKRFRG